MVPKASGQGTWRQLARWPSKYWHVVPNTLPLEAAATISVKCDPTLSTHQYTNGKQTITYIALQAQYCLLGMLTSHRGFVASGPSHIESWVDKHAYVISSMRCSLHSHLDGCFGNSTCNPGLRTMLTSLQRAWWSGTNAPRSACHLKRSPDRVEVARACQK